MEIIRSCHGCSLSVLLDGILTNVLAFCESRHFDDDVCLLGVDLLRGTSGE